MNNCVLFRVSRVLIYKVFCNVPKYNLKCFTGIRICKHCFFKERKNIYLLHFTLIKNLTLLFYNSQEYLFHIFYTKNNFFNLFI